MTSSDSDEGLSFSGRWTPGDLNTNTRSNISSGMSSLRLYLVLSCMMMTYKGSTQMYKTAVNHHLYHRFLHNELTTNFTCLCEANNNTVIPNICYPNQTIKMDRDYAQERADKHQARLLSVASSISLVTLIVFGIISDTVGRKFILLSATLVFSIQCTVVAVFIQNDVHSSVYYIPYIIDGLGGSMFGFNLGCFLYVADTVKSKRERALGLALIESLNGIGSITTKFSTLYIVKRYDVTLPVIISSVSVALVLVAVVLCLPRKTIQERDDDKSKEDCDDKKACMSVKKHFDTFIMFYFRKKYYGKRKIFWSCFVIFCLVESPIVFRSDLIPLIQIGWPNCWPVSVSNIYMYTGLGLNYVLAMILIIPLQPCLSEAMIAVLGIVSAIAFNITTALANCKELYFVGLAAGSMMIVPKPMIRAMASLRAGPSHQGALFAGLLASELVCEVISEIVFKFVYAHKHGPVDGKIFFFIGGSLCIALALAIYLRDVTKKETAADSIAANRIRPINSSLADVRVVHRSF